MRSVLTEDFYKNVIGFATILLIGIGFSLFAGTIHDKPQMAQVPEKITQ